MDRISLINTPNDVVELGEKRYKKQILRTGKWDYKGNALDISKEKLERIVRNFNQKVIENLPIFRGHASQKEAEQDPSLVVGHIEKLEIDGDNLNAIMSIDDSAIDNIGKVYKNVSVALDEAYQDHETGEFKGDVLRHVALVIEPYVKRLNPEFVALSEEANKDVVEFNLSDNSEMKEPKNVEVNEVKLEGGDPDKVISTSSEVADPNVEIPKTEAVPEVPAPVDVTAPVGDETPEVETPEEPAQEEVVEENVDEKDETPEQETKTEQENVEPEEKPAPAAELSDNEKRIKELEEQLAKVKETEKKTREQNIDLEYKRYLSEGKVVPAQEDAFKAIMLSESVVLLSDDKEESLNSLFAEFIKASPKLVEFGERGLKDPGQDLELSEGEKEAFAFMKYDKKKIEEIKRKNK